MEFYNFYSSRINQSIFVLLLVLICLFPCKASAHKVYIFAWAEDGKIFTESKFSSKKSVKEGKISVKDDKGNILLQGKTSDNGNFAFNIPENIKSDIIIKLEAGMGHQAEWKLLLDDIKQAKKGGNNKELAQEQKQKLIKQPSLVNIGSGILIIFIFFILIAYYKKKRDRK